MRSYPNSGTVARVIVAYRQGMADDFSGIKSGDCDTVVLNSVSQYFPDADYLARVMKGAIDAVRAGGHIFVGDVRCLPLLEAYHASVRLFRAAGGTTTDTLMQQVDAEIARENELLIDPSFFRDFAASEPRLGHVEILVKRGRHHNELTLFRYDVVLHVEAAAGPDLALDWRDWRDARPSCRPRRARGAG